MFTITWPLIIVHACNELKTNICHTDIGRHIKFRGYVLVLVIHSSLVTRTRATVYETFLIIQWITIALIVVHGSSISTNRCKELPSHSLICGNSDLTTIVGRITAIVVPVIPVLQQEDHITRSAREVKCSCMNLSMSSTIIHLEFTAVWTP